MQLREHVGLMAAYNSGRTPDFLICADDSYPLGCMSANRNQN